MVIVLKILLIWSGSTFREWVKALAQLLGSFISMFHELFLDEFLTFPNDPEITSRWFTEITIKGAFVPPRCPFYLEVAACALLTSRYSGVNMLSSRFHASQTATFSQRTRDQYVNRLRLSLRCPRPGEAISSENKRELVGRHSRGLSQTCPGVWPSCAQPDRRLFGAAG